MGARSPLTDAVQQKFTHPLRCMDTVLLECGGRRLPKATLANLQTTRIQRCKTVVRFSLWFQWNLSNCSCRLQKQQKHMVSRVMRLIVYFTFQKLSWGGVAWLERSRMMLTAFAEELQELKAAQPADGRT